MCGNRKVKEYYNVKEWSNRIFVLKENLNRIIGKLCIRVGKKSESIKLR